MDTVSVTIGIIMLLLFICPFVYIQLSKGKKDKLFKKICEENALTISDKEIIQSKLIALDGKNKVLIFIDFTNKQTQQKVIKLAEIRSCEIIGKLIHNGDFDSVGLLLNYKDSSLNNTQLLFANSTDSIHTIEQAYVIAQQWQTKLGNLLSK